MSARASTTRRLSSGSTGHWRAGPSGGGVPRPGADLARSLRRIIISPLLVYALIAWSRRTGARSAPVSTVAERGARGNGALRSFRRLGRPVGAEVNLRHVHGCPARSDHGLLQRGGSRIAITVVIATLSTISASSV